MFVVIDKNTKEDRQDFSSIGLSLDTLEVGKTLTITQKQELYSLLNNFSHLFSSPQKWYGRTSVVKHHIEISGPAICQPLRCVPYSLQGTLQKK